MRFECRLITRVYVSQVYGSSPPTSFPIQLVFPLLPNAPSTQYSLFYHVESSSLTPLFGHWFPPILFSHSSLQLCRGQLSTCTMDKQENSSSLSFSYLYLTLSYNEIEFTTVTSPLLFNHLFDRLLCVCIAVLCITSLNFEN